MKLKNLIYHFENLTGSKANLLNNNSAEIDLFNKNGIGYSQFNEILLLLGFSRISRQFFQFLKNGKYTYSPNTSIDSEKELKEGIERFIGIALLFYGNIKYAFKELSRNKEVLYATIGESLPTDVDEFKKRHAAISEITEIPPDKTYFLGYYIQGELELRLKNDPNDKEALKLEKERLATIEVAQNNQIVYLTSDHLDVYVATSMRAKQDFLFVNKTINEIFNHPSLTELRLRYFDPTQAYCKNRIDKGLSEALMLKTALCTLYLAQETETLGKDSELASTLAQGKAVVAYVPLGNKIYVDELLKSLKSINQNKSEKELILEQLMVFEPTLAWKDKDVRRWIDKPNDSLVLEMMTKLYNLAENYYDKRARGLKETHPLGIQVNLQSGVANGVLVVRNIDDCIQLIRNIVLNNMKFHLIYPNNGDNEYIYLEEEISGCIFRLKTGDSLLTNSFWNFYTKN
jgi:hypothetical protein